VFVVDEETPDSPTSDLLGGALWIILPDKLASCVDSPAGQSPVLKPGFSLAEGDASGLTFDE
jgi:hypothetical protein